MINTAVVGGKTVRRPISSVKKVHGKIINGTLLFKDQLLIQSPKSGQIQLAMKTSVTNGPETIAPFQGAFYIGEYDQIKGSFFSKLTSEFQEQAGNLTVENYLTNSEVPKNLAVSNDEKAQSETSSETGFQKAQVEVAPLVLRTVGFKNQNSYLRSRVFSVTACMSNPLDNVKTFKSQVFQITKVNGQSESLRSNNQGCVTWEDVMDFDYLSPECWIPKQIRIQNANLAMNQDFTLLINPWAEGDSAFRDSRQSGKKELQCAEGKSKITLQSYQFDKQLVSYPIDSFLNIKVRKEGIFKLPGRLKRPSLVNATGFEDVSLPPGNYLLRWAIVDNLVKDYAKASGYIYQAQEKKVQIDASGNISESLFLESQNLKAFGSTQALLLEVTPLESKAALNIATYRGSLILSNSMEGGNLELLREGSDSLVQTLMKQWEQDQKAFRVEQEKLGSKLTFAKENELQLLNLNNDSETLPLRKSLRGSAFWDVKDRVLGGGGPLAPAFLQQWIKTGKFDSTLAKQFCSHWAHDLFRRPIADANGETVFVKDARTSTYTTSACLLAGNQNGPSYFDVTYRYFIKDAAKVQDLGFENRDLAFTHGFAFGHSKDFAKTATVSADMNAGVSTPKFMNFFSAGGGVRAQVSAAWSERESRGNISAVQAGETLSLDKLNFKIQASSYEKCALIRLNLGKVQDGLWARFLNPKLKPEVLARELNKGYLLCEGAPQSRPLSFVESYYVLNQKGTPHVIDNTSDAGRPLFMTFRGVVNFRRIMQYLGGRLQAPNGVGTEILSDAFSQSTVAPVFIQGAPAYPGQYAADQ